MGKKFKGFKCAKYPIYSVITPHTGYSFGIRTLKVSEELAIKESSIIPSQIPNVINQILWNACVIKPKEIQTYEDFLKKLTSKDRDALIFGVYRATLGNEKTYKDVQCYSCGKSHTIKIKLDEMLSVEFFPNPRITSSENIESMFYPSKMVLRPENLETIVPILEIKKDQKKEEIQKPIPKAPPEDMPIDIAKEEFPEWFKYLEEKNNNIETKKNEEDENTSTPILVEEDKEKIDFDDILKHKEEFYLDELENVKISIRQPSLYDEYEALEMFPAVGQEQITKITDSLLIDKVIEFDPNDNNKIVQTTKDREEILEIFEELPSKDKKKIEDRYNEIFEKNYGIKLESKWNCTEDNCKYENSIFIDPTASLFRYIQMGQQN